MSASDYLLFFADSRLYRHCTVYCFDDIIIRNKNGLHLFSLFPVIDMAKHHTRDCKCCACIIKKKTLGASVAISTKPRKLKPCICGSPVCKKKWDQLKREQRNLEIKRSLKYKKCVCGSPVCGEESEKMPEMLLEAAKQADRKLHEEKQAIIKEKLYQKARKKRIKEREKSAKRQMKLQKKADKRQMKYIKSSHNTNEIALAAESLIDLGTFGSKAFCDVARYLCKSVKHSRDTMQDMRDMYRDPIHAAKNLKRNLIGMGIEGMFDRIKYRFTKMRIANAIVSEMKSHPVTNYLVHMADRNPKKRMKKFKTKRQREPRDFQCSTYMASMRKRPCLRIYYMCPWFYPHCMSLLQVYKQLMDIFLFIFAVLVWSPCILFMEIVRGCLCCLTCQG